MSEPLRKSNTGLKRRPFLTPIWLAALAAMVVFTFASWLWSTADSTTVVVVRNAETEAGTGVQPLSAAGRARAELLGRMLGDAAPAGRIGAIYNLSGAAGRDTAAVLARRLGLAIVDVPAAERAGLARRVLRDHTGGRILIVAPADAIPDLVRSLGGRGAIAGTGPVDGDTLYVVTTPRIGHANFLRLNY